MRGLYILSIMIALGAMLSIDARLKLALWYDPGRTLKVIGISVFVFLLWDVICISAGIFSMGKSPLLTELMIGKELPIEEIAFLTFLCYLTLVVYRIMERRWPRT